MILDIDLGNTRMKWRLSGGEGLGGRLAPEEAAVRALVDACPAIDRIRVSSVAGTAVTEEVLGWLAAVFHRQPELCRVRRRLGDFETAYLDPSRLGADRWLAALAAYQHLRSACVVADAGTALTVDLVTAQGFHRGGYIVPGFRLMHEALCAGTGSIKCPLNVQQIALEPGLTTDQAVNRGLLQMALGLIDRCCAEAGQDARLVLTGGDGGMLRPYLPGALWMPELVLDGLALACP